MAERVNPLNEKQLSKLQTSIEWSNRQIERYKKKRVEAIKEFVGYHYADCGSAKRVPTPFLKLAVEIYLRSLAPRVPRVLVSTLHDELKPTAADLELALNKIPDEVDLQDTFRRAVLEALFGFAVLKCGLHTTEEVLGQKYGSAFVDLVTSDEFFIDMTAKHMSQIQYIGDDYWVNYEELMDSDWFPKDRLTDLKADEYRVIGPVGEDTAQGVTISQTASMFKDKVQLRDTWLPDEKLMITYAVTSRKLLGDAKLKGPSPYLMLGFEEVPGNLLPLPPVAVWRDLHELSNSLFRKLGDQADAEKTVQGFPGGDDESVRAFKASRDGDGIRWSGGEPKILKAGGVNPTTLAFFLQCKDLFSYLAGNLNSLGGLGPQTETVGQDKLISEASSAQLRDMSSKVVTFCKEIFRRLAYYEWNDPIRRRTLMKPIPGTDLTITIPWSRETRQGSFSMYDFDIDVYSLQDDSPNTKLQKLSVIMKEYVLPLMPMLQQSGRTLDVNAVLELVAKYSDFPELNTICPVIDPQNQQQIGQEQGGGMPANTTRTYERVNRPGATGEGKDQILMQALLGNRLQQGEAAGLNTAI